MYWFLCLLQLYTTVVELQYAFLAPTFRDVTLTSVFAHPFNRALPTILAQTADIVMHSSYTSAVFSRFADQSHTIVHLVQDEIIRILRQPPVASVVAVVDHHASLAAKIVAGQMHLLAADVHDQVDLVAHMVNRRVDAFNSAFEASSTLELSLVTVTSFDASLDNDSSLGDATDALFFVDWNVLVVDVTPRRDMLLVPVASTCPSGLFSDDSDASLGSEDTDRLSVVDSSICSVRPVNYMVFSLTCSADASLHNDASLDRDDAAFVDNNTETVFLDADPLDVPLLRDLVCHERQMFFPVTCSFDAYASLDDDADMPFLLVNDTLSTDDAPRHIPLAHMASMPPIGVFKKAEDRILHKLLHTMMDEPEYGSRDSWTAEDHRTHFYKSLPFRLFMWIPIQLVWLMLYALWLLSVPLQLVISIARTPFLVSVCTLILLAGQVCWISLKETWRRNRC